MDDFLRLVLLPSAGSRYDATRIAGPTSRPRLDMRVLCLLGLGMVRRRVIGEFSPAVGPDET